MKDHLATLPAVTEETFNLGFLAYHKGGSTQSSIIENLSFYSGFLWWDGLFFVQFLDFWRGGREVHFNFQNEIKIDQILSPCAIMSSLFEESAVSEGSASGTAKAVDPVQFIQELKDLG